MTDEERHELCDILRNVHPSKSTSREAADEIERLAALVHAAEVELNEIRDCMLNDRSYYDGLIGFAGDIEAVAATLRAPAADRLAALAEASDPLPREHQDPSKWPTRETVEQTLRDAAENLLIAIGMGWDIEGCVENLRATLAQSDAQPVALDKFKRGRIAHKAAMAIRPETVGDGEYWRLRCAINDVLREELAQSDAEPVGWQTRAKGSKAWYHSEGKPDIDPEFYEVRLLYAAPPRPDASAGVIEAAEMLDHRADHLALIVEGRQELINSLYVASDDRWSDAGRLCKEAAEEIERLAALAQSDAKLQEVLRRCERWLRHEVEATFQEEDGYDLWEAVKTALAQSDAEPVVRCR